MALKMTLAIINLQQQSLPLTQNHKSLRQASTNTNLLVSSDPNTQTLQISHTQPSITDKLPI